MRTQTFAVRGAPNVTWYAEQTPEGTVWLHFDCATCGDSSMRQCSNFQARAPHWVSVYAMNHAHGR